ncbi:MAG: LysR family transcriptional regulator [Pseudomonadota bacterium]
MNWNDLRVFVAIAEHGTLAGAARALGNNHSTVFRRLEALEKDVAVRLFERLPTGYELTSAGERMLALARPVRESVDAIERDIVGRDLAASGPVRLTTAPNLARTLVPNIVATLRREHSGITIETIVGDNDYDLNRREADLALRATTKPPEHLVGRHLATLDWWICSGRGRRRVPRCVAELADFDVVGADDSLLRLESMRWLERHCRERIVARSNDLSTMAALAKANIGLAALPSDQPEDGLRRLFKLPGISGELWLLAHPDIRQMRRVRLVWDAIVLAVRNDA